MAPPPLCGRIRFDCCRELSVSLIHTRSRWLSRSACEQNQVSTGTGSMRISGRCPRCCPEQMKLLPLVAFTFLFVPTLSEDSAGVRVVVEEGSDVVLPCSPSTNGSIVAKIFAWRKDGSQKDVFFNDLSRHSNNGFTGQDEQFRGRVSHYEDQVMNGNASIKIQNTKVADSGNYSCFFPRLQPRQTFIIELVVERLLRDQSEEIPACRFMMEGRDDLLLQCQAADSDLSAKPLDVTRPDLKHQGRDVVHAYRHQHDFLADQMDQYKGRTTLSHEDLKNGTVTLRISSVDPSDSGRYRVFVPGLFTGYITVDAANMTDRNVAVGIGVAAVVVVVVVAVVVVLVKLGQIKICKKMLSGPTGPEAELNSDGPEKETLMTPETNSSHSTAQNGLMTFTKASEPEDVC